MVAGQASLTTTFSHAGKFPVAAVYSGPEDDYQERFSHTLTQVVEKATPHLGIVSSSNPSIYGSTVTLKGFVISEWFAPITGTITFKNGSSLLGVAEVMPYSGETSAALTVTNLPAGSLSLTATYSGDSVNNPASAVAAQVVNQASTTTTISSSVNPSVLGHVVRFTATITSPTVSPVHTGTVTFTAGATTLGTINVEGGKAALTTSSLPAGTTTVTATYNGTTNIAGSSHRWLKP